LDVSIGTITIRLSRGRIQLRKLLEQAPVQRRATSTAPVRQTPVRHQVAAQTLRTGWHHGMERPGVFVQGRAE